jgi:DNA repair protein RadC
MSQHIFELESELQNIPEASPSFSVSEKLARYGSTALSTVEHLTLLVGKESIALALMRHFGSLKALSRASFLELRQFLPQQKAEAVIAALSVSAIAETEHSLSDQLDNAESIYHVCADMKLFNQEVLRVILLVTRYWHISTVKISKGTVNESLAHPREIFRPVIALSAFAFVLVHNKCGAPHLCYVDSMVMWSGSAAVRVQSTSGLVCPAQLLHITAAPFLRIIKRVGRWRRTRPCTHKIRPNVRFNPKATELPARQRNDAMW